MTLGGFVRELEIEGSLTRVVSPNRDPPCRQGPAAFGTRPTPGLVAEAAAPTAALTREKLWRRT
jgi:hypothetical protein